VILRRGFVTDRFVLMARQQPFEMLAHHLVALTRGLFEAFAVNDDDFTVGVLDEAGFRERAEDEAHGWAARAKHHPEKFVRETDIVAGHAIVGHQQPPGAPLLDRMQHVHAVDCMTSA